MSIWGDFANFINKNSETLLFTSAGSVLLLFKIRSIITGFKCSKFKRLAGTKFKKYVINYMRGRLFLYKDDFCQLYNKCVHDFKDNTDCKMYLYSKSLQCDEPPCCPIICRWSVTHKLNNGEKLVFFGIIYYSSNGEMVANVEKSVSRFEVYPSNDKREERFFDNFIDSKEKISLNDLSWMVYHMNMRNKKHGTYTLHYDFINCTVDASHKFMPKECSVLEMSFKTPNKNDVLVTAVMVQKINLTIVLNLLQNISKISMVEEVNGEKSNVFINDCDLSYYINYNKLDYEFVGGRKMQMKTIRIEFFVSDYRQQKVLQTYRDNCNVGNDYNRSLMWIDRFANVVEK